MSDVSNHSAATYYQPDLLVIMSADTPTDYKELAQDGANSFLRSSQLPLACNCSEIGNYALYLINFGQQALYAHLHSVWNQNAGAKNVCALGTAFRAVEERSHLVLDEVCQPTSMAEFLHVL
jgi:hypothetical protein